MTTRTAMATTTTTTVVAALAMMSMKAALMITRRCAKKWHSVYFQIWQKMQDMKRTISVILIISNKVDYRNS